MAVALLHFLSYMDEMWFYYRKNRKAQFFFLDLTVYSVYFHTLLEQAGLVGSHTYTHTYTLAINLVLLLISSVVIVILMGFNN